MADSNLANAVTRATGKATNDAQLMNLARANMPEATRAELPQYQKGQSFVPYGQKFEKNPRVFNDYLESAAIKYGKVFIKNALAKNPLNIFKRGLKPYGGKIETWVFDTIEPKMYRPDLFEGEESPFAQHYGRVEAQTHIEYQDIEATNTVVDTQDTMYFQDATQFNNFLYGKVAALVNGAVLDEYRITKLTLAKSLADGMITTDEAISTKDLQKKIVYWSSMLQYFSRDNNVKGINQATLVDDLVVIIPLKRAVDLDMDYLANVFNAEIAGVNVKTVQVDKFPDVWKYTTDHTVTQDDYDNGYLNRRDHPLGSVIKAGSLAEVGATDAKEVLNGDKVGAFILDKDALQLWDELETTLSGIANPKKRYNNLFINKKTAFVFVEALNSKAIMCKDF